MVKESGSVAVASGGPVEKSDLEKATEVGRQARGLLLLPCRTPGSALLLGEHAPLCVTGCLCGCVLRCAGWHAMLQSDALILKLAADEAKRGGRYGELSAAKSPHLYFAVLAAG